MTEWKKTVILGASDEDADWIKSLPGHKDEMAIHEELAKKLGKETGRKET